MKCILQFCFYLFLGHTLSMYLTLNQSCQVGGLAIFRLYGLGFLVELSGVTFSMNPNYNFVVFANWNKWSDWSTCSVMAIHKSQQMYTSFRNRSCDCKPCTIYCRIVPRDLVKPRHIFWCHQMSTLDH